MALPTLAAFYAQYRKSAHWRGLRSRRVHIANRHCEGCGKLTEVFEVHHVRYRSTWFDTILKDLMALCPKCHDRIEAAKMVLGEMTWHQTQQFLNPPKKKRPKQKPKLAPKKGESIYRPQPPRRKWSIVTEEQRHDAARQRTAA